ncbi:MAG: hypothetical protein RLZZ244_2359 [Verrucomicrobiota bacterium]|jgi:predicted homoserine dehydrogenase-like protein
MNVFRELRRRQQFGRVIRVAVVGQGPMGRGVAAQIHGTPGMHPAVLVNRSAERAVRTWVELGYSASEVVVSEHQGTLEEALERGIPAVTRDSMVACDLRGIEVVVEATGTVGPAARTVLGAIHAGKHILVMNPEVDATLGCYLSERARQQGVVYSHGDGGRPGVLMRLCEWVEGMGFEVRAAFSCTGELEEEATPESSLECARRMGTSPRMVCAVRDGTKLNLEKAVLANATGLVPEQRGMRGWRTSMKKVLRDFSKLAGLQGVVDYTVGGDFGGGVFVIARCEDWARVGGYLDASLMGPGPDYVFFRPYHLGGTETPVSIAEAVLFREPTVAPRGVPVADVVAVAKRDLAAGTRLDGVGGTMVYGRVDAVERSRDFLPVGLSDGGCLQAAVRKGEPIPWSVVEAREAEWVCNLRRIQERWSNARGRKDREANCGEGEAALVCAERTP